MRRIFLISLTFFMAIEVHADPKVIHVPTGSYTPFFLNPNSKREPVQVHAFWMDKFPVTNEQYRSFLKSNPRWRRSQIKPIFSDGHYLESWRSDLDFGEPNKRNAPVTRVSWFAAHSYCVWLGKTLPTVDQWEYAASNKDHDRSASNALILEWYSRPTPKNMPAVGTGVPNQYGIYDLYGLIWEWTEDFNSSTVSEESRDSTADSNLFCGSGSQGALDPTDYASFMRYAFRDSLKATYSVRNLGFRCIKEAE